MCSDVTFGGFNVSQLQCTLQINAKVHLVTHLSLDCEQTHLVTPQRGGGGYSIKFYTGRLRPKVQTHTL